jgi:hypothetical protein
MNCGLVTAYQVREGGKGLKQKLLQKESAKKIFHHTSLPNITLRMKVFRVSSKRISYLTQNRRRYYPGNNLNLKTYY